MTTKIKTTLLTAFFLFGLLTGLQAQEKYEYATLKLEIMGLGKGSLYLATDNNEYKEISIEFSSTDKKNYNYRNSAPALKWIKENGWEIVEYHPSTYQNMNTDFLLRKKKQNGLD